MDPGAAAVMPVVEGVLRALDDATDEVRRVRAETRAVAGETDWHSAAVAGYRRAVAACDGELGRLAGRIDDAGDRLRAVRAGMAAGAWGG